jgi:hypothetical protein
MRGSGRIDARVDSRFSLLLADVVNSRLSSNQASGEPGGEAKQMKIIANKNN